MADQIEQTVDTSGLESAVRELTKAANETSLNKGGIENSGTTSDGKPAGGGQTSDFGALDDMMIGKMSAAGLDAGTIAMFGQFLAAKAGEEVDEEDEDEPSGAMAPPREPITRKSQQRARGEQPLNKSTMDQLREDPVLNHNVDVSDYLEHITLRVAEQLDGVRKSMSDDRGAQQRFNAALAKSTVEMAKLVKSQAAVIGEMGRRLGIVERQPVATPKGATTAPRARALQKSMPGEAGQDVGQLRKSELLSTLTYLNLEKGIRHINGQKTSEIVSLYEGGGVLDEATVTFAKGWLSANPGEAEMAKSYA